MNEHVALWPKLTLARELPFVLAGTQVRPSALEVEFGGDIAALEPRVMKVLVALHRAKGHPVSRDELIDLCWEGRIVTEGALNRCVMQLRKALAANPRIRLDTIPTVGYRLQAGADVQRTPSAANNDAPAVALAVPPSRRLPYAAVGVAAILLLAVVTALVLSPRRVSWTTADYHPLTAEPGMESHPAISPNGQQLVYAQRPNSTVGRDLYIRGVEQGTPMRITSDPADDHSAAWSPAGDRIAFVRSSSAGGPCSLVVVPVPIGPERVAGRCHSSNYTRVSWLDADTLAIGDRPGPADLWRIRAVNLTSGVVQDVTTPPADTLGDSDPSVSPDGRFVAFRRSLLHGADDLFLKDLRSGRERALTTDGWKAAGYVWSADSRHIFYASNRGGEFGLWTVDTARNDPPERIGLGVGLLTFSRMSIDRKNRLVVETPLSRTNLAALSPQGDLRAVTEAAGADGAVAYASSRTGGSELWVTTPDGSSVRLTQIGGSYVHSPAWSPDGRGIVFVAVRGRKAELYTVARDGSQLRAVTSDGRDKADPIWAPDGSIIYAERTAAGYRTRRVPAAGGAPRAIGAGGYKQLRMAPDGRLFGVTADGDTVRPLFGGAAPEVRLAGNDNWAVGRSGIYVLRARRETAPAVWLHPWSGAPRRLGEVSTAPGRIGVTPDGGVILSRSLNEEVDLGMFDLSAR